jgi:hypothetical protein
MQTKRIHKVEKYDVVEKICDKCGRKAHFNEDVFEYQEFQFYYISGGYGSVFGDPANLECDLCQHCVKELLGPYLRDAEQG